MENIKDDEFILFVGQEANFQTRSMLVPAKEFLQVRKNDYDILKRNALKCVPFKIKESIVLVDQLIKLNLECYNNKRMHEKTEYTSICDDLIGYCDRSDEDMYFDKKDLIWLQRSIMNVCSNGFNHINNYITFQTQLKEKYSFIHLYDSFLILETQNGKFQFSPFESVDDVHAYIQTHMTK